MQKNGVKIGALMLVLAAGLAGAAQGQGTAVPTFTVEQANAGKATYEAYCANCHGQNLDGAEGPAVAGDYFQSKWSNKSVHALYTRIKTTMPTTAPNSLSEDEYVNIVAYLMQTNHLLASPTPLVADASKMKAMTLPPPSVPFARPEPGLVLPPAPNPVANPLDKITPVTEALLKNPPPHDWLNWRRTNDAHGFSPLKQITKENAADLRLAWSWSLPSGTNEGTPLVHDGVMFVYGYGDVLQALNAATGDLLWQYSRDLPKGQAPGFERAIAIYGNKIYLGTSDAYLVALDVKTGEMVWESSIAPRGTETFSGPTIAKGKVIVGTNLRRTGSYLGGSVVAFDAETGKRAWTFNTIPKPGEHGGDTWNDVPYEKRSGGSVWVPGSYDPDLNLAYFGVGQTYDTGPLLDRKPGANNDALYTNATLAINPDTGKLVWYYQHMANDQWDLDWAFERHIFTMPVKGKPRKVIATSGKSALYDVLDAKTGAYISSVDLGIQNYIKSIDPKTGMKNYDPEKMPGHGRSPFVCPHPGGSKSWIPASFNDATKVLFVPMVEACMIMTPSPPGEGAMMTSRTRIAISPMANSDGRYGRIHAINLETGKTVWMDRQRAPRTSGIVATAGGVLFSGSLDRTFAAYDQDSGKKLWETRLAEVPSSAPITYEVNGKQYVAAVVGLGGPQSIVYAPLIPEVKNAVYRASSLWVFALPEK